MLRNVLRWRTPRLVAGNENTPDSAAPSDGSVTGANIRALATGAALAVAVDASPAVLVSIYDYAHRYGDKGRRTA